MDEELDEALRRDENVPLYRELLDEEMEEALRVERESLTESGG